MSDLAGLRALVTGASSGIGREIARELAGRKCDLVITGRRGDRLEALAAELRTARGVDVRVIQQELEADDAPARLFAATEGAGLSIDLLINNAGFGDYRAFADQSWQRNADMLRVNVMAMAELTHRFLGPMLTRGRRAYILNVASIAAYEPVPYFATYAASKHYVLAFSESLAHELEGTHVSVTCICPGATRTEFVERAGQKVGWIGRRTFTDADRVARTAVRAMLGGRRNVVPGLINKLTCLATRLAPHRTLAAASVFVLGKPDGRAHLADRNPDAAR
jgi:uncharacterized protein